MQFVDLMDETYLPFTENELRARFADVHRGGDADRHLKYYKSSLKRVRAYAERDESTPPTRSAMRYGRQIEKDERFWVATALMSLYVRQPELRQTRFAQLMAQAELPPPSRWSCWEDALGGPLDLYFEVNLPAPPDYRANLGINLKRQMPIPHLQHLARRSGRFEGTTKVDALLVSATGVAVFFEAKVLSDVSSHVEYDITRNQLARLIDVSLQKNSSPSLRPS